MGMSGRVCQRFVGIFWRYFAAGWIGTVFNTIFQQGWLLMKVLVTGGGGSLGQAVVRRQVARGDEVSSINRSDYPARSELVVSCHRNNIADAVAVVKAAEVMDFVIHVAAQAAAGLYVRDYVFSNLDG